MDKPTASLETVTVSDLPTASAILNRTGARLMEIDGKITVGIWSDVDGPEVRTAIKAFGYPPVRYLDGATIPERYKVRDLPGVPVPLAVLQAMQQNPIDPWRTRDDMLAEMDWRPDGIPWAKAQAVRLNLLFQELDATGKTCRIVPATVQYGKQ
jgi:hypothetical protein